MRPVLHQGSLSQCPAIWYTLPIGSMKVNHQRTVFLNGSQPISLRHIVSQEPFARADSVSKQTNTLDEISGQCTITRHQDENEVLRLDFELPEGEQVVLDTKFLDRVLSNKDIHMIQNIESVKRVYETDWMDVNLTSTSLNGRAVITRTFDIRPRVTSNILGLRYHSDVDIEILWPNKGLLFLRIFNLNFKDCYDILREDAHPEECVQTSSMRPKQKIKYYKFRIAQSGPQIYYQGLINLEKSIEINVKDSLLSHFKSRLIPVQLGRSTVALDLEETLTAELVLTLIEPPEPLEYFERLNDQKFASNGPPVKVRALESEFACSDWCAWNGCQAFSYCSSERVCRIVASFNWSRNNPTGCCELAVAEGCALWRAPNGTLREPIGALMAELEEDVANDRFSINWSSFGTRLRVVHMKELSGLLATEDEQEQEQEEEHSTDEEQQEPETEGVFSFLLMKPNARLIVTEENSSQFRETASEATLADCMRSCSRSGCQLFSYCSDERACTMLAGLASFSSYSANLKAALANERCSTYGEDFVANYQHFSATGRPNSSRLELSDLSLQECAARCELGAQLPFTCLAFDYCHLKSSYLDRPRSKCYLQALHVTMEDFDESLLARREPPALGNSSAAVECAHYSSTMMRDFWPHPRRRYERHPLVTYTLELQKCAMICRAHRDTCLGFEHCHHQGDMSRHDTCFVHHSQQSCTNFNCSLLPEQTADMNQTNPLLPSDNCTVYTYRWHASGQGNAPNQPTQEALDMQPEVWLSALRLTLFALVALLAGLLVQLAYIRCLPARRATN